MTLSFNGTGTVVSYTPGAKVKPFQNVRVLDSSTDGAKSLNLTVTVSDIAGGGPTDADGTLTTYYGSFKQIAPGTYTFTGSATLVTTVLESLTFTTGTTPGTTVFTLAATDKINQTASDNTTQVVAAVPPTRFLLTDNTAHNTYALPGKLPPDTTSGVSYQYVVQTDNPALSADNLNITALTSSTFIHTGGGTDAIDVSSVSGKNILDGGTNSNFLTGTLAGKGTDTFFVDARNAPSDIWDTVVNFHAGDAVTLFGLTPTNKAIAWADNQGTGAATGLTLHATQAGAPQASFTLAGYTTADLSNGRLGTTYGTEPDGTPFLYVVGLK